MNMKLNKLFAAVVIAAMVLAAVSFITTVRAQSSTPPQAPAFYVNPSSLTFYTPTTPIGTLFNVTVMAEAVNGTDSWSVQVGFNASQLQAVDAGFTAITTSQLFAGHSTTPLGPIIDNVGTTPGYPGVGSVEISETLLGSDFIAATNASVCWVEFNVTAAPMTGQTLTSLIDPGFGLPPVAETLFILQSPSAAYPTGEIDYPNTAPCTYSLASALAIPPTISNVTQVPSVTSVNASETVFVSANITDNSGVGLYNATLLYSTDNVTWTSAVMSLNATTGLWGANIPGYTAGTQVYYEVQSYDNAGNVATVYVTTFTVLPEFPNVLLLVMLMVVLAAAVLVTRKKKTSR